MNQFLRIAFLVLLIISLSACATSTGNGDSGLRSGEIAGNSSATLDGGPLGTGATSDVSLLRKELPVALFNPHPALDLGTAYLTRPREGSENASLIMPVSNTGATALCFVLANGLTYRSGTTNLTDGSDLSFVDGSVGTVSGTSTNTCLDAGETGYFIDLPGPNWSEVDNLQIDSLSSSDTVVSAHGGRLVPTSYSTDGSGALTSVSGANQGSITLYPSDFSVYILLDDAGAPLEWSFLNPPSGGSLIPGSSATWTPLTFGYAGSSSRLRVHFDYDLEASTTSLSQGGAPLTREDFLELREDRARILNN